MNPSQSHTENKINLFLLSLKEANNACGNILKTFSVPEADKVHSLQIKKVKMFIGAQRFLPSPSRFYSRQPAGDDSSRGGAPGAAGPLRSTGSSVRDLQDQQREGGELRVY